MTAGQCRYDIENSCTVSAGVLLYLQHEQLRISGQLGASALPVCSHATAMLGCHAFR